jgi:uncharacterized membrane protein (DUF4010 family)
VSSTATTLVYTKHARAEPEMRRLSISVILLANLVVLPRLAVLAAILAPAVLPRLLPVLGAGLLFGLLLTFLHLRSLQPQEKLPMPGMTNPTELRTALGFGLLYAGVLLVAAWLSNAAGAIGLYAVALASGLVDVDPIALSSMRLLHLGQLAQEQVVIAITVALLANLAFKWSLVLTIGGRSLAWACLPAMAAVAVGCGGALFIF